MDGIVFARRVAVLAALGSFAASSACNVDPPGDDSTSWQASITSADDDAGSDDDGGSVQHNAPDERPLVIATPPPPPITGGGLVVLDDGNTVVAADPDRDAIHLIDLAAAAPIARIDLGAGAQPWRPIVNAEGVHVVLRGRGEVATIDPASAEVVGVRTVCPNPRGIAVTPSGAGLFVACAGGDVWRLPPAGAAPERFVTTLPDLRDVLVTADGSIRVSRFRSAEVLAFGMDGTLLEQVAVPEWMLRHSPSESFTVEIAMQPNTAWRTIANPQGGWLMLHQSSTRRLIDDDFDHLVPPSSGYGAPVLVEDGPLSCGSLVQTSVTLARADGTLVAQGAIDHVIAPVDIAIDPTGTRAAIAVAGSCPPHGCAIPHVVVVDLAALESATTQPCHQPASVFSGTNDAQMIGVAYAPDGRLVAQQREPAMIHVMELGVPAVTIAIDAESVEDTGHRLFHEAGEAGIACASCHAEGGDDGLVWTIDATRHTPALDAGLAGTAPFHWSGDLDDFAALVAEVHEQRMGALFQSPERAAAFESWVTGLRQPGPRAVNHPAALAGRAVFEAYRCDECHVGEATTSNETVEIDGGEPLQVPPLHAVALHPPYFHNARAATLEDAVRDMIGATTPGASPTDAEVSDLVAFLETL